MCVYLQSKVLTQLDLARNGTAEPHEKINYFTYLYI